MSYSCGVIRPPLTMVLIFTAFIAAGCSAPGNDLSFRGAWHAEKSNEISGEKTEADLTVAVSGNRFRIESRSSEEESLEVYDGKIFYRTSTPLAQPGLDAASAPPPSAEAKTDVEMESRRFWKRGVSGSGMAGGQIAGRDTLLFQGREKMLDGEMSSQVWVDAGTKVVLKKIFIIYSSQIDQMVSKSTEECREIKYGPVEDGAFAKP